MEGLIIFLFCLGNLLQRSFGVLMGVTEGHFQFASHVLPAAMIMRCYITATYSCKGIELQLT